MRVRICNVFVSYWGKYIVKIIERSRVLDACQGTLIRSPSLGNVVKHRIFCKNCAGKVLCSGAALCLNAMSSSKTISAHSARFYKLAS